MSISCDDLWSNGSSKLASRRSDAFEGKRCIKAMEEASGIPRGEHVKRPNHLNDADTLPGLHDKAMSANCNL